MTPLFPLLLRDVIAARRIATSQHMALDIPSTGAV
jgi:hypothetical protein